MNKFKKIILSIIVIAIAATASLWLTGNKSASQNNKTPKIIMIPAVGAVLWIWNIKPGIRSKEK
ncbi:MAG: hypothetical protein KAY50_08700 [Chitinophagaceae bacterium]|nr:hypothetical protein [Chitinophagaceae bacterium]